jgi:hypothetical protein
MTRRFQMKKNLITAITLVVVIVSSTAFASLSEGTWTSSSGAIKNGSWALTTYGNLLDTGVLDSRSYPTGQGYSWEYLGSAVNSMSWTDFTQLPDSSLYYRGVMGFFSGGNYPFKFNFTDGNNYTITNTSGSFIIVMSYDSFYNYIQTIDSYYMCQGIVDQDHNYMMTITSEPVVLGMIDPFIVGTMDNINWVINEVPIPTSVLILASGLLGLIGFRRRITS